MHGYGNLMETRSRLWGLKQQQKRFLARSHERYILILILASPYFDGVHRGLNLVPAHVGYRMTVPATPHASERYFTLLTVFSPGRSSLGGAC